MIAVPPTAAASDAGLLPDQPLDDAPERDHLLFAVNGALHEVRGAEAFFLLSTFLRERLRLVGTKIVCSEGDCGACTVLVGEPSSSRPATGEATTARFAYRSIDSCIAFLYQLDRCHVVTVDSLAKHGLLHPVQTAMAEKFGSQCGFCTPGFVMALCELDENARLLGRAPSDGELRVGLSGNLCRCTGYVQILDAARSLGGAGPALGELHDDTALLAAFAAAAGSSVRIEHEGSTIHVPATWTAALEARRRDPEATVVAGATDVGVQVNKGIRAPACVLHLRSDLPDFGAVEIEDGVLRLGAGARWADVLAATKGAAPELARILELFGAPQIRNAGTVGGNLVNASPIADSLPFLYVAEATLQIDSAEGRRRLPVADFYLGYKELDLRKEELLGAVEIPLPKADERIRLLKVSRRRDLDISTFTAALWVKLEDAPDRPPASKYIADARLALGGVGPTVLRLPGAEALLRGAPFALDTFRAAGARAAEEIKPISDVRGQEAYRRLLARNALVRFFYELGGEVEAAAPAGSRA